MGRSGMVVELLKLEQTQRIVPGSALYHCGRSPTLSSTISTVGPGSRNTISLI